MLNFVFGYLRRSLKTIAVLAILSTSTAAVWASEVEITESTPVYRKEASGPKKIGTAKVGQKFLYLGKTPNGKFYKIKVKGNPAFVATTTSKVIGEDLQGDGGDYSEESSHSKKLQGAYLEFGGAWNKSIGVAPDIGLFYAIGLGSGISFDIGAEFAYFPFNSVVKVFDIDFAGRLSIAAGPVIFSPEVSFDMAIASALGVSATSNAFAVGLFAGFPAGSSFVIMPGARYAIKSGSEIIAYLNFQIRF